MKATHSRTKITVFVTTVSEESAVSVFNHLLYTVDGGKRFLWNTGLDLPYYTTSHATWQWSSPPQTSEPQISEILNCYIAEQKFPSTWTGHVWTRTATITTGRVMFAINCHVYLEEGRTTYIYSHVFPNSRRKYPASGERPPADRRR